MTRNDDASTYADLLARLGDDGTKALFRRLLEEALQELIDAELTAQMALTVTNDPDSRSNYRNGVRPRTLSTPAGDVELRIPNVRVGSFFPELLEPRRRVDKALWAVIMTAYAEFPAAHWRKIASTNPLERVDKGIKRRSNVVGIFPDDQSVLRLVGAVLAEVHDDS